MRQAAGSCVHLVNYCHKIRKSTSSELLQGNVFLIEPSTPPTRHHRHFIPLFTTSFVTLYSLLMFAAKYWHVTVNCNTVPLKRLQKLKTTERWWALKFSLKRDSKTQSSYNTGYSERKFKSKRPFLTDAQLQRRNDWSKFYIISKITLEICYITIKNEHIGVPLSPPPPKKKILKNQNYLRNLEEVKSKAIQLQSWTGPEGSRGKRVSDFKTIGTRMW